MKVLNEEKQNVNFIFNKIKRQDLQKGLQAFLDNSDKISDYYNACIKITDVSNIKNLNAIFESNEREIVETIFTPVIEQTEEGFVILPVSSKDKDQCREFLDLLSEKIDTHRLVITADVEELPLEQYNTYSDLNF